MGLEFDFCGDRIYIDANILIYAMEDFPQFSEIAGEVLRNLEEGLFEGVTSELTIAEVLVAPLRKSQHHLVHVYQELLQSGGAFQLVPITRTLLVASAQLRSRLGGRLADSIHVATAVATDCNFFMTEDRSIKLPQALKPLSLSEFLEPGATP
jgi:predicted nucleic acid-binding protein